MIRVQRQNKHTVTYSLNLMLQVELFTHMQWYTTVAASLHLYILIFSWSGGKAILRSALKSDESQKEHEDTQGKQGPNKYDISDNTEINHFDQIWLHTNDILCLYHDRCSVFWTRIW